MSVRHHSLRREVHCGLSKLPHGLVVVSEGDMLVYTVITDVRLGSYYVACIYTGHSSEGNAFRGRKELAYG